jgi:hypothetical protein
VFQKDGFPARANGGESAAEGMHFWPPSKARAFKSSKNLKMFSFGNFEGSKI